MKSILDAVSHATYSFDDHNGSFGAPGRMESKASSGDREEAMKDPEAVQERMDPLKLISTVELMHEEMRLIRERLRADGGRDRRSSLMAFADQDGHANNQVLLAALPDVHTNAAVK